MLEESGSSLIRDIKKAISNKKSKHLVSGYYENNARHFLVLAICKDGDNNVTLYRPTTEPTVTHKLVRTIVLYYTMSYCEVIEVLHDKSTI